MRRRAIEMYLMLTQTLSAKQLAYAAIGTFVIALAFAVATAPSAAAAGAEPPLDQSDGSPPSTFYRVVDDHLMRECGKISDQCSGWIYVGLCKLGIREAQVCRYCERDCDTGEKRCHRTRSTRCKIPV